MEQPTTEPLTAFLVTHEASDSIQNSCITILTYTAAAMEVKMALGRASTERQRAEATAGMRCSAVA